MLVCVGLLEDNDDWSASSLKLEESVDVFDDIERSANHHCQESNTQTKMQIKHKRNKQTKKENSETGLTCVRNSIL